MTARSLHAASVAFTVGGTDVGDGVIGVGKGVLVAGNVEVRKRGAGVGAFDKIETLQEVRAIIVNKEIRANIRIG